MRSYLRLVGLAGCFLNFNYFEIMIIAWKLVPYLIQADFGWNSSINFEGHYYHTFNYFLTIICLVIAINTVKYCLTMSFDWRKINVMHQCFNLDWFMPIINVAVSLMKSFNFMENLISSSHWFTFTAYISPSLATTILIRIIIIETCQVMSDLEVPF